MDAPHNTRAEFVEGVRGDGGSGRWGKGEREDAHVAHRQCPRVKSNPLVSGSTRRVGFRILQQRDMTMTLRRVQGWCPNCLEADGPSVRLLRMILYDVDARAKLLAETESESKVWKRVVLTCQHVPG